MLVYMQPIVYVHVYGRVHSFSYQDTCELLSKLKLPLIDQLISSLKKMPTLETNIQRHID